MASPNPLSSTTNLFRRLTWQSSIPLEIRLAEGEPGAATGADVYYMHAPRYTYLPLLIPEIRENLVDLALDDQQLAETNESDWWFEEEADHEPASFASQGACRWHWSIDLIHLYSIISRPHSPSSKSRTLRLLLHLSAPPTDKLMLPASAEACRTQFINQVKEADFVRWRNTNKVTSLRRADLEAGWDGIVQDDYDLYMRMASRVLPLPSPGSSVRGMDPGGGSNVKSESSYAARAVPVKIYLPDGAPVVQEVIPPLTSDGKPITVIGMLRQHLPLLFPPSSPEPYPIAFPIGQGVELPPEAEMAWLSACVCGVDGWLRIGVRLRGD